AVQGGRLQGWLHALLVELRERLPELALGGVVEEVLAQQPGAGREDRPEARTQDGELPQPVRGRGPGVGVGGGRGGGRGLRGAGAPLGRAGGARRSGDVVGFDCPTQAGAPPLFACAAVGPRPTEGTVTSRCRLRSPPYRADSGPR